LFFASGTYLEALQKHSRLPRGARIEPRPWKQRGGSGSYRYRPYTATNVVDKEWKVDGLLAARVPKLCFVLSGHVTFDLADYKLHCKAGHAILIPPGVPYPNGHNSYVDTSIHGNTECNLLQVLPHPNGHTTCWTTHHRQESDRFYKTAITSSILHSAMTLHVGLLMEEYETVDEYHDAICSRILQTLLMRLVRELRHLPTLRSGNDVIPWNDDTAVQQLHPISQAQEYIRSRIGQPLTIEHVAQRLCMSRTAFTRQFRERTGKSFSEYVNDYRFQHAQIILKETDLSIEQVGKSVGVSAAYLRMLFQKRLGISPITFRNQSRESEGKKPSLEKSYL
jgi:AraC-like DNA-binding protein